ncbi:NUDIX hydrolase [Pimelobacter simplex]|uniref:NUDIX hydrolase n=1 Tax=Nocardioides simplex TaxID=2045 RepID=A0A7J5E248_NOCSI|nr:NUDIX hydrolase [Pimelobacter simplex]KAB2812342.1 NUDIX hydrolase [Pimelobacter simplex]
MADGLRKTALAPVRTATTLRDEVRENERLRLLLTTGAFLIPATIIWIFEEIPLAWRVVGTLALLLAASLVGIVALSAQLRQQDRLEAEPLPADLGSIPAAARAHREVRDGDPLLLAAHRADFVGLTYKSLSDMLDEVNARGAQLGALTTACLYVYALPVLEQLHPTLRHSSGLLPEWSRSIENAIEGLRRAAPALRELDLVLLDAEPAFTMSRVWTADDAGSGVHHLRWTPVVAGTEPKDMPTLRFESSSGDVDGAELYQAFSRFSEDLISRRAVRRFPLVRADLGYERADVAGLVELLAKISTHPIMRRDDVSFDVSITAPVALLGERTALKPWEVRTFYEAYLDPAGAVVSFTAEMAPRRQQATIRIDDGAHGEVRTVPVTEKHRLAAFALMTLPGAEPSVLLVDKPKGIWALDVPGGKVGVDDADWRATIRRELVEELALVLPPDANLRQVAWSYDPKSQKEGVPVLSVYAAHLLEPELASYARSFLVGKDGVAARRTLALPAAELLRRKAAQGADNSWAEPLCHAPRRAFEAVVRMAGR